MADGRSTNTVDVRLGQRVRARRLELGMSQEHLAELLGITFQQVQKYEKGVNRIAASRLFAISAALEIPVGRFFDGLDARGAGASTAHGELFDHVLGTPEGMQLASLFASITSAKIRRRVADMVRAIASDHTKVVDRAPEERGRKVNA